MLGAGKLFYCIILTQDFLRASHLCSPRAGGHSAQEGASQWTAGHVLSYSGGRGNFMNIQRWVSWIFFSVSPRDFFAQVIGNIVFIGVSEPSMGLSTPLLRQRRGQRRGWLVSDQRQSLVRRKVERPGGAAQAVQARTPRTHRPRPPVLASDLTVHGVQSFVSECYYFLVTFTWKRGEAERSSLT